MADFNTHITTSTVIGVGYGAAGYFWLNFSPETSVLAAGLCSVAGMLPDLDSDTGVPLRETLSFGAAAIACLMQDRWRALGMSPESMALAGVLIYIFVRFGIGGFIKNYTVHRGMFHSVPAAAIAGLLAFLVCQTSDLDARYFKAAAVVLGYMVHLALDELWSIDLSRGVPRLKSSSGTAIKFYGQSIWANISTYAKLALLIWLAARDPGLMEQFGRPLHRSDMPMAEQPVVPIQAAQPQAEATGLWR